MTAQNKNKSPEGKRQTTIDKRSQRVNISVAIVCLAIVSGMAGLSYAAVPLYRIFCQVTGFGGTTQQADGFDGEMSDREITVSFDANSSSELNWKFKPKQRSISIRLGQKATAIYFAENVGTKASTGEATFNVTPQAAGQYFNKIECFCFTEQTLAVSEKVEMPVLFFVDPEIENDPLLKTTTTITLSYSMYPSETDEKSASLVNPAVTTSIGEPDLQGKLQ